MNNGKIFVCLIACAATVAVLPGNVANAQLLKRSTLRHAGAPAPGGRGTTHKHSAAAAVSKSTAARKSAGKGVSEGASEVTTQASAKSSQAAKSKGAATAKAAPPAKGAPLPGPAQKAGTTAAVKGAPVPGATAKDAKKSAAPTAATAAPKPAAGTATVAPKPAPGAPIVAPGKTPAATTPPSQTGATGAVKPPSTPAGAAATGKPPAAAAPVAIPKITGTPEMHNLPGASPAGAAAVVAPAKPNESTPPVAPQRGTATGAQAPAAAAAAREHSMDSAILAPYVDTESGAPLPGHMQPAPASQQPHVIQPLRSAVPKDYPDGRGHTIHFPQGDLSFADEAVSFEKGNPPAGEAFSNPSNLLGPPDYKGPGDASPCVLTLGCRGNVIMRFTDNVLVDVPGPDLFVFEVGEDEEPTDMQISEDGRKWIDVGKISGSTAAVDIKPFVMPGEVFHFVRLRDLGTHCEGDYPGADIDAVGAIGSAVKLSIKSSVLFDYKESAVKPDAKASLNDIAFVIKRYPKARVVIEGHTDNVGDDEYNLKLSEERAKSVRDYLVKNEGLGAFKIETKGYGKTRPIAANTSDAGREKNRRVEILVLPESVPQPPAVPASTDP